MQTKADSDRTEYFTCISGFDCQHHGSVPWIVSTEALKLGRCFRTKFSHFLRLCRSFVSLGNICISVLTIGATNLVWTASNTAFSSTRSFIASWWTRHDEIWYYLWRSTLTKWPRKSSHRKCQKSQLWKAIKSLSQDQFQFWLRQTNRQNRYIYLSK